MAELTLVIEEAEAELSALRELLSHSEAQIDNRFMLGAQARGAMAHATILYLAASFEETVRQLGQAYIDALALKQLIPEDRLKAIQTGLWERALKQLGEQSYGRRDFDPAEANSNISILKDFCLDLNDINIMQKYSVYNYRNMKVREINTIFKRLGIADVCNKIGRCSEFKGFFLVDTLAKAQDQFIAFLDNFYDIRNKATHELGIFRSQGAADSGRLIDFFLITINRLGAVLSTDLDGLN